MWKEIISADDDVISGELLDWSGLRDTWDRHDLVAYYDFTNDIAEFCDHIYIEKEEWDANLPGRSGTWHTIETDDPDQLKKELRSKLAELLWTSRKDMRFYRKAREEKEKKEKEKREREWKKREREWEKKLKELENGPTEGIYICTIIIEEAEYYPTHQEYFFEASVENSHCLRVWEKTNCRWTDCQIWNSTFEGDLKSEAIRFLNKKGFRKDARIGNYDRILDVLLGPLFDEKEV
jgi:hypothetical protein